MSTFLTLARSLKKISSPPSRAFCTGNGIRVHLETGWGIHLFGLLRFITGMGGIGSFVVAFVLLVEHVGRKVCLIMSICQDGNYFLQFTTLVGIAIEIPFALGEAFLGLEAFFIRYDGHKVGHHPHTKFWI